MSKVTIHACAAQKFEEIALRLKLEGECKILKWVNPFCLLSFGRSSKYFVFQCSFVSATSILRDWAVWCFTRTNCLTAALMYLSVHLQFETVMILIMK